ncbi:hypothetical protein VTK56DRAFT_7216 [Thermocarpiscus australiensis]
MNIMAFLMSVAQYARKLPTPRSVEPSTMKQKMPVPVTAISKPTATGLIARLRFRKRSDTTSYVSTIIPSRPTVKKDGKRTLTLTVGSNRQKLYSHAVKESAPSS